MGDELQFETADYAAPAAPCGMCAGELAGQYFEANGQRVCTGCHAILTAPPPGTPGRRFLDALGWGSGAAVLGFCLYYAVYRLTGYELGLISIAVGYAVGLAVSKGARAVGGVGYQILAVVLTYLSISATYYMLIVAEITKAGHEMSPLAYLVAVPLAMAVPFLAGFDNVLGLLIIGFGLYQAWKINQRRKLEVVGPFGIKAPAPDAG